MEDDMACEYTPTEFPETVHQGLLHHDRGKTNRGWYALPQQTRHNEHLRIARELRHTWLQGLLSASMQPCLVNERLPADLPTKPILRRPLDLIRKAFDKGRGSLQGLRFPALPDGSLEKALGDICDDFSPSSRIRLRMVILGETRPLVPTVQEQVYWIAREALLNALRHSAASRIETEIEYLPRKLRVVVRDDGTGIDPKTLRTGRNGPRGLTSMQERAASIAAMVRIWSKRGAGTEVEISLPILGKPA
jgi:signal transduction histidine kinase